MLTEAQRARFWQNVRKGDGCWLWTGRIFPRSGRPCFWASGRNRLGHRVALEMAEGRDLAPHEHACHKCNDILCVRVAAGHVYNGNVLTNAADRVEAGGYRNCHPPVRNGDDHPRSRLTGSIVRSSRMRHVAGEPVASIARSFGVNEETLRYAVKFKTWRTV